VIEVAGEWNDAGREFMKGYIFGWVASFRAIGKKLLAN